MGMSGLGGMQEQPHCANNCLINFIIMICLNVNILILTKHGYTYNVWYCKYVVPGNTMYSEKAVPRKI